MRVVKNFFWRLVGALDDYLSLKVQFCVAWMVLVVLSGFKTVVVVIAAIFGILALYIREIQKPGSNLTRIIISWLTKQNFLSDPKISDENE
jgi:phage-related minor tail protein